MAGIINKIACYLYGECAINGHDWEHRKPPLFWITDARFCKRPGCAAAQIKPIDCDWTNIITQGSPEWRIMTIGGVHRDNTRNADR